MILLDKGKFITFTLLLAFFIFPHTIMAGEIDEIYIAGDDIFKANDNATRETVIKNLAEDEIYYTSEISVIDGFIYLTYGKEQRIIKLSPMGKVLARFGKIGQGPGEFGSLERMAVRKYNNNIAAFDYKAWKVILFTPRGEFVREFKVLKPFSGALVNRKNQFVFSGYFSEEHYFNVFSDTGKFLFNFAKKLTDVSDKKNAYNFDIVRKYCYLEDRDGFWVAFRNRYDLRYYENSKLKAEIKGPEKYFKYKVQEMGGRKIYRFSDKGLYLAADNDRLFYFYGRSGKRICDIFDLKELQLQRRIQLKRKYNWISHYEKNVFYSIIKEDDEAADDEKILLVKIEILDENKKG